MPAIHPGIRHEVNTEFLGRFNNQERKKIAYLVHRIEELEDMSPETLEGDTWEKQELGCLRWVLEEHWPKDLVG